MCGICGVVPEVALSQDELFSKLYKMGRLIAHRGPDGEGYWIHNSKRIGFGHRRLSIIDPVPQSDQPMFAESGNVIVFNGEIYNYIELRQQLASGWTFRTKSDTEVILAAYDKWGSGFLEHLRGMFALALWDEKNKRTLIARDRLGIKPLYYSASSDGFYFASEVKALLPFLKTVSVNQEALSQYFIFQYPLKNKTLFSDVHSLQPGHFIELKENSFRIQQYWEVDYHADFNHTRSYFEEELRSLTTESVAQHMRSDVPVASYASGGIDSSLMSVLAADTDKPITRLYHGRFDEKGYDESDYAKEVSSKSGVPIELVTIKSNDFLDNIEKIVFALDYPVAGPGAFPQYMVSKSAGQHYKVILGGQGGDELFGGYARYLIAYLEQCIKACVEGTHKSGNFVVTPESIIPNLIVLKEYKELISTFWSKGLFGELDERYFRLIDRSADFHGEVEPSFLNHEAAFEEFKTIFNGQNVGKMAYFDKMTHFDLKCLLPSLLQVEDRMSMAFGLESRVPLLDHKIVEFSATIPADIKFPGGKMKDILKTSFANQLPQKILDRKDKMGFPVPLKEWLEGPLKSYVVDTLTSESALNRPYIQKNNLRELTQHGASAKFSRKLWAFLCLEIWHKSFIDAKFYKTDFKNESEGFSRRSTQAGTVFSYSRSEGALDVR